MGPHHLLHLLREESLVLPHQVVGGDEKEKGKKPDESSHDVYDDAPG